MFAIVFAVLLIGGCWAFGHLSFLPASAVLVLDSLATAFRWIGVTDPAVGWLLLGVLGGAMLGAFVGLRRAGRAVTARHFGRLSAVVAAAMLVAGSRRPDGEPRTAVQPSPSQPAPMPVRHMYVAAEHASVRAWPGSGANVVAQLPGRSPLDVLRASSDGAWWYVQGHRGSRMITGWVRRSALVDGVPVAEPDAVSPPPTDVAQQRPRADTVGGEVVLPNPAPPSAPPRQAENVVTPARVDSGAQPATENADRGVVADVQARLAEARASVTAGDYAAALRALAAADEAVTIASARYGDPGWLATLRRNATTVRESTRASCQAASAQAASRGEAAPRCE